MTVEQMARNLLDRAGIEGAQEMTAGDVVEIANLINEVLGLRAAVMNVGAVPEVHMLVEQQSRKGWPTLWAAIDHLVRRAESLASGRDEDTV